MSVPVLAGNKKAIKMVSTTISCYIENVGFYYQINLKIKWIC